MRKRDQKRTEELRNEKELDKRRRKGRIDKEMRKELNQPRERLMRKRRKID